ncbi:MAG: hypothetical protein IT181_20360 [Acidobacteria bacterium]|nr:hypothetical protein [Acidobacteriota bacterium]
MSVRGARVWRAVLFGLPGAVLLVAFGGIVQMTGSAWPWHDVVHEDGVRTLLRTIFYFEHATRELLPDLVLAVGIAGSVRYFLPPTAGPGLDRSRRRLAVIAAGALLVIVGGTVVTEGARVVLENLSQSHTRAGAPLVWGAHWLYHFLDRAAELLLALSLAGALWIVRGCPGTRRGGWTLYRAAWAIFAASTIVFRPTLEPFVAPAFLGHQLRELLTHGLVTVPLALGVCAELARRFAATSPASPGAPAWRIVMAAGLASAIVGAFLLAASLASDAQAQGQASGLAALIFPHFFEHALGYLFVPALAGFLYLSRAPRQA